MLSVGQRLAHASSSASRYVLVASGRGRGSVPAWHPWPDGLSSEAVFCFHYPRRVANDATVSWPGGGLALPCRRRTR